MSRKKVLKRRGRLAVQFARLIVASLLLTLVAAPAWAFRCGTSLVREGDYDFEVLQKCGEPSLRELIGYTLTLEHQREFKIERWVYGPDKGVNYVLRFEAGVLKSIESRPSVD